MKKILFAMCLSLSCVGFSFAGVVLNSTNFPDENFRNAVKAKVGVSDGGTITDAIIAKQTDWSTGFSELGIESMEGIQHFTALTRLDCHGNALTQIDLSKNVKIQNLYCYKNQLTSLNVSFLPNLKTLNCSSNQIKSIDVSKNTLLSNFLCHTNYIESLDVKNNPALTFLTCYRNKLTSLDLSSNLELTELRCSENKLSSLDVLNNTKLTLISCHRNRLQSLNLITLPNLKTLQCQINEIRAIDVSKNTELTYLDCGANQLTYLDVTKNAKLENLYCSPNQLTTLDISNNPALEILKCDNNHLLQLDASKVTSTITTFAGDNQSRQFPAKFVVAPAPARYVVEMPNDFVNDSSKGLYVENVISEGVTMSVENGNTYFNIDPKIKPLMVSYNYRINNGENVIKVNIIPSYPFLKGDVDENGIVNVSDVTALINLILGAE